MPVNLLFAAEDHRDRVPADEPADAALELLVAGEVRLLLRADGVDVPGVGEGRQPDLELARPLQELEQQEPRPGLALLVDDVVERADPVDRLLLVDVGQLVLELVEVHLAARLAASTVMRAPRGGSSAGRASTSMRCSEYERWYLARRPSLQASIGGRVRGGLEAHRAARRPPTWIATRAGRESPRGTSARPGR